MKKKLSALVFISSLWISESTMAAAFTKAGVLYLVTDPARGVFVKVSDAVTAFAGDKETSYVKGDLSAGADLFVVTDLNRGISALVTKGVTEFQTGKFTAFKKDDILFVVVDSTRARFIQVSADVGEFKISGDVILFKRKSNGDLFVVWDITRARISPVATAVDKI